jgi:hypothetical protein
MTYAESRAAMEAKRKEIGALQAELRALQARRHPRWWKTMC